ncbi:MAG: glycosyltransferase [Clostridiaceae bacterium]
MTTDETQLTPNRDDWSWTTLLTYHNGSCFVESALNSVSIALQQLIERTSPSHHIELLVVDDCSTEEEVARLLGVTSRLVLPGNCHTTVVRLGVNRGVSAARYEGLRRTTRSFVHIMDQDDEVKRDFYASVLIGYANMKSASAQDILWIAGCEHIDAKGVVTRANRLRPDETTTRHLNDVGRWLSVGNPVVSPGMVVLSPSLRDEAEQYYESLDRSVDGSDDYLMFIHLLKRGAHFVVADELGFRYRKHEFNQSSGHSFQVSTQRGLVVMSEHGLLSERECSIVTARGRLQSRLERHPRSRLMRLLVYLSSPLVGWRLLQARLTS